jgi:DNA-binding NarL/FixJ family response regulator
MGGHAGTSARVQATEPSSAELTVVIASGHPLLALGVRGRLEGHGFQILGEASSAGELVTALGLHRPDICLVDAALPGGALAAARQARARRPGLAVVFLMSTDDSDDGELAIEAARCGAAGVLFEDMDPDRLVYALRDVAAGGSAFPRMLVPRLLGSMS